MSDSARTSGPRCIAIVGPFASGKTTLLEEILARNGVVERPGSVTAGNTVGDGSREARLHAMSVECNVADSAFMGDDYTFIDCPGSVEFGFEMEPVLAAVDAAIVVAEPDEKKIPALQVILRGLEERGIPRLLFLNKIDRATLRVREALSLLQPASRTPLVLRQIPIWKDGIATGFIDLALDRAFVYREHAPSEVISVAGVDEARRKEARFTMLETLADHDDALMEQLLEEIEPPRDAIFGDLVREMRDGVIVPVFIGSAQNGNGIMRLLKALRHETPGIAETCRRLGLEEAAGPVVQVMKTIHTTHGGKLSLARVLAGRVEDGTELVTPRGEICKVGGVQRLVGTKVTKRGAAERGDTVALGKLDAARTGDTLAGRGAAVPALAVPEPQQPVLQKVVKLSERKDEVKLSAALARMSEEDPSLVVTHRQDTGETLLGGQGEMHLRVAVERLASKYGLGIDVRGATVAYRETIRGSVTKRGRHKKQSGGHGQFGDVVLELAPLPRGSGIVFTSAITGGVVPKQYVPAVEAGVREALQNGPLGGFPVVDVAVKLTDGSAHPVDSSDQAFRMAAILGIREALPDAQPVLLEPVLRVSVAVPSEATAKVNAIVSSRRGQLMGYDARPGWAGWDVVEALIPEAEMADLIIELRSATAGVGTFTTAFDHLAEVQGRLADDVLAHAGRKAA
ncbi:elongation factor G [Propylenella binzhouense]|uniref:Elongation factor G n=1 Tax=Propylenella binzhouense TaxID=2555902 RepID=A0A964T7K5_9HYPH|nr:elongation factor G [Propylenella binzhouense]MYZ48837.1 elongation factor G [Propylenella binzhouense]